MLGPRFAQALVLSHQLHATQRRKGTAIPYVSHPLQVAGLALEFGAGEDEAVAALLHDALEDFSPAEVAARLIEESFGTNVLRIVRACTDSDEHPKPPWRERKQRYLDHLEEAPEGVLIVSVSDKIHNLRSIVSDLRECGPDRGAFWARFNAPEPQQQLWYYEQLERIFTQRYGGAATRVYLRVLDEFRDLVA